MSLDTHQKHLRYRETQKLNYVACGSAEGFSIFKRPVNGKHLFHTENSKTIDFNKIILQNAEEAQNDFSFEDELGEMSLWSDDDEDHMRNVDISGEAQHLRPNREDDDAMVDENEGNNNRIIERSSLIEIDSDSSEGDPLRSVYLKQIERTRNHLI